MIKITTRFLPTEIVLARFCMTQTLYVCIGFLKGKTVYGVWQKDGTREFPLFERTDQEYFLSDLFGKHRTGQNRRRVCALCAQIHVKRGTKRLPDQCSLGRMAILVYRKSILSLRTPVLRDNATNQGKIDMETEHGTIRARFLLKS